MGNLEVQQQRALHEIGARRDQPALVPAPGIDDVDRCRGADVDDADRALLPRVVPRTDGRDPAVRAEVLLGSEPELFCSPVVFGPARFQRRFGLLRRALGR